MIIGIIATNGIWKSLIDEISVQIVENPYFKIISFVPDAVRGRKKDNAPS